MRNPYDKYSSTSTYDILHMDKPDLCILYKEACDYYKGKADGAKSLLHKLIGDELQRRRNNFR